MRMSKAIGSLCQSECRLCKLIKLCTSVIKRMAKLVAYNHDNAAVVERPIDTV